MGERPVVLVTGGSRGIGKEIAKKFAKEGYDIVLTYVSENTKTEELIQEFSEFGIEVLCVKANVVEMKDCEEVVKQTLDTFGKIDVLVNNAGITKDGLLMRMKEEDFEAVIKTNLQGTFHMSKAVISTMMKKREGRIVNISSVVGISGNAGQCNYAASKAGMIGFTKSLAKEVASRGILANCIAPGFIATDMTAVLTEEVKEQIQSQIPLKRMGSAEEVANTVYFLGSKENTYITGQVLPVDGGMVM